MAVSIEQGSGSTGDTYAVSLRLEWTHLCDSQISP
jgi:hypothetical protein